MSRILSISRRTDIPAFYGPWFERRLYEGFVGWENPCSGQRYLLSLKPEDVMAFVFWSKNYRPFLQILERLKVCGFPLLLNYTISGLPTIFEPNVVPTDDAINSLSVMSRIFSPDHINWRYDPIVISDITPAAFHEKQFAELCRKLRGKVNRCYFSFTSMYGKVARNFRLCEKNLGVNIEEMPRLERIALVDRLCEIAGNYGIEMYSCCGDYLINEHIKKAHCVDGEVISRLCNRERWQVKDKPTRNECGCTESTDIGKYDSCPHECVYCYANTNKEQALKFFNLHDPSSAFLGYDKMRSDLFIEEILRRAPVEKKIKDPSPHQQLNLF
jgi:hypothetical protein